MREQIHTEAEVRQARLAYDKGNAREGYMTSATTGRQRAATYPTLRGRCRDTVATLYMRERAGRSGRRRETNTMRRSSTIKVTISRPQTSSKNTKTKIPTTNATLKGTHIYPNAAQFSNPHPYPYPTLRIHQIHAQPRGNPPTRKVSFSNPAFVDLERVAFGLLMCARLCASVP